ncbi:S8 family serine peptidase [uncultured Microbacterium sp.]|uniref:S8 family peptidase n=1 Tax=uncultured Microbacterium sp. TaxID=191216 RepID=UPI0025FBBC7D|nr:S8 family serine peptidase [uncultured Microbacterium sp.]
MKSERVTRLLATSAAAITIAMGAVSPMATAATTEPTPEENLDYWWNAYGVDAAHQEGLTGSGVKVAVLEKQINPELPVFQGRSLRVFDQPLCVNKTTVATTEPTSAAVHGTTMTAYVIGNGTGAGKIRGIAPDADVTFYGYGEEDGASCTTADGAQITEFAAGVKQATDDGAKIIFTSIGGTARVDDAPAVAYAISHGAVVIAASINPGVLGARYDDLGSFNGVVSAAGINRDGSLQTQDGEPFVVPQTTVVAAGVDLPAAGSTGDWSTSVGATGSSFAPPIVAGMLALAAQKSPQSSGDQLVQALITTTNGAQHAPMRTEDGYGYGAAWLPSLLAVDAATMPDETPLMGKPAGFPTEEQIAQAKENGYTPEARSSSIDKYREKNNTSGSDAVPVALWIAVGLGLLVIAAIIITVIVVLKQRRRASKERAE